VAGVRPRHACARLWCSRVLADRARNGRDLEPLGHVQARLAGGTGLRWFAWERRRSLATIPLRPFWPGLLAVAAGCLAWLVANAAGVAVVEQLAVIGLVAACIVTVFGWRFGRELAFPLAFLFFAVQWARRSFADDEMTATSLVGALG